MQQVLSIQTLCDGAVEEKLNRALRKVSDNILDPNTPAEKKREAILKLSFASNEDDREDVMVGATVETKLAPEESVKTQLFISKNPATDTVTIMEHVKGQIKGQMSLDDYGFNALPEKEFDAETGEIIEEATAVIDFKAQKEG